MTAPTLAQITMDYPLPSGSKLTDKSLKSYLANYKKIGSVEVLKKTNKYTKGLNTKDRKARPILSDEAKDYVRRHVTGATSFLVHYGGKYHMTNDMNFRGVFVLGLFKGKDWKDRCIITRDGLMSPSEIATKYNPGGHSPAGSVRFGIREAGKRRYITLDNLVSEKYLVPPVGQHWDVQFKKTRGPGRLQSTPKHDESGFIDPNTSLASSIHLEDHENRLEELANPNEDARPIPGGQVSDGNSVQETSPDLKAENLMEVKLEVVDPEQSNHPDASADPRLSALELYEGLRREEGRPPLNICEVKKEALDYFSAKDMLHLVSTTLETDLKDYSHGRTCDLCVTRFFTLKEYADHRNRAHGETRCSFRTGKNYAYCSDCHPDALIQSHLHLFRHLEEKHRGEKRFSAEFFWSGSQKAILANIPNFLTFENQYTNWRLTISVLTDQMA